jgi:hypothetical protein
MNNIFAKWEDFYAEHIKPQGCGPSAIRAYRVTYYAGALAMMDVHYKILSDQGKTDDEISVLMDAVEDEVVAFFEQNQNTIQ